MKPLQINYNGKGAGANRLMILLFGEKKAYCYWCGQKLHNCEKCRGKGTFNNQSCQCCDGTGVLCATHNKLWD
jgi:hypothetical protein